MLTEAGRQMLLDSLVRVVQEALSLDLLRTLYQERQAAGAHPLTGHCYVASEALYHLLGGADAGWTPMHIQHEGESHWYLRGPDGTFLDPTEAQFRNPVPHWHGKGKGFMTSQPSRRAQVVIDRVNARVRD